MQVHLKNNSVRQALSGKNILLIGATGFLAKVFLEKLVRVAPDVGQIFLLIRANKEQTAAQRLQKEIVSSQLFNGHREQNEDGFNKFCANKLRAVAGDISELNLGLQAEDYLELLSSVDLVINSGASTDFMEPLDRAVASNTISVLNVLEFVKASERARLLHVSTCYVNEAGETCFTETSSQQSPLAKATLSGDAHSVLNSLHSEMKRRNVDLVDLGVELATRYGWNNIYTFTKWLGEKLITEQEAQMFCTIVRPSIIESCINEPIPGWVEGFKVADPLLYAGGSDTVKMFPGNEKTIIDIIPADLVSNAMFLSLAELSSASEPQTRIYQACSSDQNPVDLKAITEIARSAFGKDWIQRRFFVPSAIFFAFWNTLSVIATFLKLGSERKIRRLVKMARLYQPYTSLKCTFANRKLRELHLKSSAADRLEFPVSAGSIDWYEYLAKIHLPGLERFVVQQSGGEHFQNIPKPIFQNKAA